MKLPRVIFVAECLAHLANAEGRLHAGGGLHILEVNEDALGSFGPHVVQTLLVIEVEHTKLQNI